MNKPNYSREFCEAQYNGRGRIPNYERYFEKWAEDSQTTRDSLTGHLDLAYGTGPSETLDLFIAPHSRRLLVFIHGGYWRSMDKRDFDWVAAPFVAQGLSVAVPNYALCPQVAMPTIVEQCRRAIVWLARHAREYGAPTEMIITGHSAGGHLTGMMLATDWTTYGLTEPPLVGGVAVSGLFDLEPLTYTTINDDLRMDIATALALSPIYLRPAASVPLVVVVGGLESDEFQRQSHFMCGVWTDHCVGPFVIEDRHHFNILDDFTDLTSPLWSDVRSRQMLGHVTSG